MASFIISELAKKDIIDIWNYTAAAVMMKSGLIYVVSTVGVISYFTVFSLNEK